MRRIRVLGSALADQIAAGEVVERPASVVKELVENALDAGATNVQLIMSDDGVGLLEVRDDGHGMSAEDAVLAVKRHATSKLHRFDDLLELDTLGFRGEALPSIASVSRLELRTRTRDEDAGTQVVVTGGAPPEVRPIGCPVGTVISVRDLFYNVPARRKFLKSRSTEGAKVAQVLRRVALARPNLRLRWVRDGRTALEFLPTDNMSQRLRGIFPKDSFTAMTERRGSLTVRAWLGRPEDAKSGTRHLYLFVNDRPVQDRKLARAVAHALGEQLPKGRYPNGAVFLELPAKLVDVNVHPQKAEVRFADETELLRSLASLITTGVSKATRPNSVHREPVDQPAVLQTAVPPSAVPPSASDQHPTKVDPPPSRAKPDNRSRMRPRSPNYWNDRLGFGKLQDGQRIGTATVRKQGRSETAKADAAPPAIRPSPELNSPAMSSAPRTLEHRSTLGSRLRTALPELNAAALDRVIEVTAKLIDDERTHAIEVLRARATSMRASGHPNRADALNIAADALASEGEPKR